MKNIKRITYAVVIGLTLIAQLFSPVPAYADGETTPSPQDPSGETATPEPTEAVETESPTPEETAPAETSTPAPPTETLEDTAPPETTETKSPTPDETAPVEISTPAPPTEIVVPAETAASEEETTAEEPTLAEALQELPDETEVVVLDENSQPLPLVTTEAAEIVESSDPMWCPAGVTSVTTDCVNADTVTNLLPLLASKDEDGVIYFYTPTPYNTNDVIFNGTNLDIDQLADNSLTLQGGWDGAYTLGSQINYAGQSVFTVPITISNWNNSITVTNITVRNATGSGLTINNAQDVTITSSTFSDNSGNGAYIENSGNVIIDGGEFSGNSVSGVKNYKSGNITINSGTFSNNTMDGVNNEESGNITIKGGTFSGNDRHGVRNIYSGDITIDGGTFSGNDGSGVTDYGSTGTVTINGGTFSNNTGAGVYTDQSPYFTIYGGTFTGNNSGVYMYHGYVTINGGTFSENVYGMYMWYSYDVNITGGEITENDYGVYVLSCESNLEAVPGTIFNNSIDVRLPYGCEIIPIEPPEPITYFQNQGEFELDCIGQSGFAVDLPNGDLVNIFCPVSGTARIYRLDNTTLPAGLPTGYTYASAYTLDIIQYGEPIPVITEGGYIKASFVAQPLQPGNTYAVLYWDKDTETWMELKDFLQKDENGNPRSFDLLPGNPDDGRIILSGVNPVTRKGAQRVEVSTNFPGVFVLAQH